MSVRNNKKSRHSNTSRTAFVIKYLEALKRNKIRFTIVRGHKKIFSNPNKDIDILMNPSDYSVAISCYKDLIKRFEGVCIASSVSNKNLYLKSVFMNGAGDSLEFQGLYIHITAYVTIKTSYKYRNVRYVGKKIWIDSFENIDEEVDGVLVPVPNPKMQVLILLSRYAQKKRKRYIYEIREVIADNLLQEWVEAIDRYGYLDGASNNYASCEDPAKLFSLIDDLVRSLEADRSIGKLAEYAALIRLNAKAGFRHNNRLIFFSGPDGAGKTTAYEALTDLLRGKLKIRVVNSKCLYPLPSIRRKQSAKMRAGQGKINPADSKVLERDRGHTFLWRMRRLVGLLYLLIQMYPGYFYARYKNYTGYTVIIDTSFFDAFVKRHRPDFPLIRRLAVPFLPCGDNWFLMAAEPEEIVARKPELTIAELIDYYERLEEISNIARRKPIKIPSNLGAPIALKHMIVSVGTG